MSGPLGKYSQTVAALVASFIIVAQVVVWVADAFGVTIQTTPQSAAQLTAAFYIALGAVFGAAASTAVNGEKIEAAHKRLDIISAPPADMSNTPK